MKMAEKRPLNEAELEKLFAEAADDAPQPSDALMARILADAQAELPKAPAPTAAPRRGWLAAALGQIGGWPAAAGLATAAVAGLAIGLATPEALEDITGGYLTAESGYGLDDLMPSYGDLLGEG